MFDYIKRLQYKPPEERKKVALVIAGTITLIIFFIWFTTFGLKEAEPQTDKEIIDLTLIENIKGAVEDIYTNFKDLSESIKSAKDSITEFGAGTTTINTRTTP